MLPRVHAATTTIENAEENEIPMWIKSCEKVRKCLLDNIIIPNLLENVKYRINDIPDSEDQYDKYIFECSILPHYGATDYVFLYDKVHQQFVPVAKSMENIHDGDTKWLPDRYRDNNRYCWITVCLFNRQCHAMFKWPSRQPEPHDNNLASWPCVIRDANRIGYNVMTKIDTSFLQMIEKTLLNKVCFYFI